MNHATRKGLITVGIIALVVVGLSMIAGGMMQGHMFTPDEFEGLPWMWRFGMGLGGLMMLIFWGVVITAIVLLVRQVGQGGSGGERPLDILKRRYAAGEITREQYEQMKQDITK